MVADSEKTKKLDDSHFRAIAERAAAQSFDDDKTQIVGATVNVDPEPVPLDHEKTRIYRPGSKTRPAEGQGEKNEVQETLDNNLMEDPPTGWLVAIEGPGQGSVLTVGIGMNSVGRGVDVRVPIEFNDQEISRGNCFSIAYDARNKNFFLLPGDGKSLVYLKDQPLLERMLMKSGMIFNIGQTSFRFVALCDAEFSW